MVFYGDHNIRALNNIPDIIPIDLCVSVTCGLIVKQVCYMHFIMRKQKYLLTFDTYNYEFILGYLLLFIPIKITDRKVEFWKNKNTLSGKPLDFAKQPTGYMSSINNEKEWYSLSTQLDVEDQYKKIFTWCKIM